MVARLRYLFRSSTASITTGGIATRSVRGFLIIGGIVSIIILMHTGTANRQRFRVTPDSRIGMLQYVPPGYYSNSEKYPLIIFLHGIVERGIDSRHPDLIESQAYWLDNLGPPELVAHGHDFPFILVSPQLKSNHEYWPVAYIMDVVNWARDNLRVDEKRIYITGLSLGGGAVFSVIQKHPDIFAAAVPICAHWNDPAFAKDIAREKVGVWAFHGDNDPQVPLHTNSFMIDSINRCIPQNGEKARLTVYHGLQHSIWDRAYLPAGDGGEDIYTWMLQHVKAKRNGVLLPVADAGEDQSVSSKEDVLLKGRGTAGEIILSSLWEQVSGPPAAIENPQAIQTKVKLKRHGVYCFRLRVTDKTGNTDQDFVNIFVR